MIATSNSWFRNAETAPEITLATILEQAVALLEEGIVLLYGMEEDEASPSRLRWYGVVANELKSTQEWLGKVDCEKVSAKQAAKLAKALQRDLPKWLPKYFARIASSGPEIAHDHLFLRDKRISIDNRIVAVVRAQNSQKLQHRLNGSQLASAPKPLPQRTILPQVEAEPQIIFPAPPSISKEFKAHWMALREQWGRAYADASQVEDKFRLEQLASVHLPESLKMFKVLQTSSAEAKAEAEELLAQQLVAAEQQIEQIAQKYSADALIAMRAQTAFMRSIAQKESTLALPGRLIE